MHLHNEHTVLISPVDSIIYDKLNEIGINTVFSEEVCNLISYERFHADMQLLVINDTAFIPDQVSRLYDKVSSYFSNTVICKSIKGKYPGNVALNAALIGKYLFCKASAIACEVYEYCSKNGITIVNVKQGYTKCSTLIVDKKAIITADIGIYKAAEKYEIDCLLIKPGYIYLDDKNYGFIGGASAVIGESVLFFGDINTHPDAESMINFIKKHNKNCISLTDHKLSDIGGAVLLK